MTEPHWHLAQLNVGRMLGPIDAPEITDFVANLEPINAIADTAPGFVWRLQTDDGNATSIHAFDDPLLLLNMSVWESIEALRAFTYSSDHTAILGRRREWFEKMASVHLVLWWVPAGHVPTVEEAIEHLELLRRDGPTPAAFTFRSPFTPDATGPGEPLVDARFCWPEALVV
jgi:Domain of unknown function (DUF3291)